MIKTKPKSKSSEQAKIDRVLNKRKKWLIEYQPECIFCSQFAGRYGDLAHKIRRSYASSRYTRFELQTMKKNTGLSHRVCHDIFDNDIIKAERLPNFLKIMDDIKSIDELYYNRIINKLESLKK